MEITVSQMYAIENKGHGMGFLKKFMMENAGAAGVRRLVETFGRNGVQEDTSSCRAGKQTAETAWSWQGTLQATAPG